jgi:hypothetical protein
MKSLKIFIFLGVGIVLFLGAQAWADVPKLINFQGRLTDGSGTPVKDSTYSVLFTIYDDSSGGTNLWSETQPVATKGGTFNVNLGSATALPDTIFDDTTRYLAMKVGTDPEMTPRQRMVSMAYGYRVRTVDGATGGTISGDVAIQSDLTVSGNVGIGTTNPMRTLHIASPTTSNEFVMEVKDGLADWRKWNFVVNGGTGNKQDLHLRILNDAGDNTTAGIMSWLNNGNVGIGTTSPSDKLEVSGNSEPLIRVTNTGMSGNPYLRMGMNSGNNAAIFEATAGKDFKFHNGQYALTILGSNGNVGIGTTVPSGRLHVADATGGNSSVILPNGSISAAEILDEPGVASNANSDGVAIASTALAIILSRTITVPAAGYVLVLGTTQFEVTHVTGVNDLYNIGVSGSSTALPVNQDLFTTVIAALPTGTYQKVVSPHGLFVVPAGANTFYLLGQKTASTSDDAIAFDSQLTLVFFPTAYGTVVGTFQNSASEQDDGAIDAPDRE